MLKEQIQMFLGVVRADMGGGVSVCVFFFVFFGLFF